MGKILNIRKFITDLIQDTSKEGIDFISFDMYKKYVYLYTYEQ